MIQSLHIRGVIPSLNKIQTSTVVKTRTGKRITKYGQAKKAWTQKVQLLARSLRPVESAYFTFLHLCTDRRTDPDNFCGVAQKVVLDGFKKAGRIPNDGWEQVLGLAHYWKTATEPGVVVVLSDHPLAVEVAWGAVAALGALTETAPKRRRKAA